MTMRIAFLAAVTAAILLASPRAEALVVNVTGPGALFDAQLGPALPGAAGVTPADLVAIANVAGNFWEGLLAAPRTIDIQVGFSNQLGGGLAATVGGSPSSIAAIGFASDANLPWFLDPTPLDNSEYATALGAAADFGGGSLNFVRAFTDATGDAVDKYDLFSVALHEIGHALGLSGLFDTLQGDDPIEILAPLLFAGSLLPFSDQHIDLGMIDTLMDCCLRRGARELPSDADILAVAQAGRFAGVTLVAVPEPSGALLAGAGVLLLLSRRRRA
jgi:hypothetical protein